MVFDPAQFGATPIGGGTDWLRYANQSAVRSQPLNPKLTSALSFLPELGVEMEVFSGGQPAPGEGPRVGSTRHDHGNAADVFFYKDGRKLDWSNPQDRPIFEEIVRRGRAAGITGFGAGEGYMRPGSMHIGFGTPAVWGDAGKGANAPEWLRNAFAGAPSAPAQDTATPSPRMAFAGETPQTQPSAGGQAIEAMMVNAATPDLPTNAPTGQVAPVSDPVPFEPQLTDETSVSGRPIYRDPSGEFYSERTVTFPVGDQWVTFPAVDENGNIMSEDQVRQYVVQNGPVDPITGEKFPTFNSREEAEAYARQRSSTRRQPFDPAQAGAVPFDPSQMGAVPVEEGQEPVEAAAEEGDGLGGFFRSLDSFVRGAADVATFGFADEISAGMGALTGIGGEQGDYTANLEAQRATDVLRREEDPIASMAGGLTGAVGTGVIAAPRIAATLGGRIAQGTALGAGSGGAYGFGSAEGGFENRALGGAQGAALGAAVGGAVPVATAGVGAGYRAARDAIAPRIRATLQPGQEAGRRVGQALGMDRVSGQALGQADEAPAMINDQRLLNVDRGGENTRALARSAANVNPDARAALERTASDRFASQGTRAQSFINRIMRGATDDLALQDQLKDAARKANRPAYNRAYREGADMVMTPEMERLTSSPAVVKAMRAVAEGKGRDRAVAEGMGSFNPRVNVTQDGRIVFNKRGGNNAFPDLQFWDYTKRELDDMANAARASGNREQASTLESLARSLREELDDQVPSYAKARKGAAAFFGAEDAIEAGRKFMTQNKTIPETRRALEKMTKAEREAFSVGFASEMKDTIASARDRTNVIDRIFGSEAARDKIRLALGPERFKEFEQFVRVENAMDQLRGALGNSTTARQLFELGMAGGIGTGAGFLTGDWKAGLAAGLLVRGGRAMGAKVDENVAKRVADLLLSDDPKQIEKAVQMAAKNPKVAKAIRGMTDIINKGLVVEGSTGAAGAVTPRPPLEITVGAPQ